MTPEPASSTSGRRFHLLEIVGAGAFGEVYLAEQDSGAGFRRKVAIKLLHADVEKIREAGSRMRDEARILARLSHRNIVTVLDLVRLGERWAVVMDYVPGADLEEVVRAQADDGEAIPAAAALEAGAAVLRALDAAYHATDDNGRQLKVVHRDIKPSNVRLTTDGEIKVLDFGVARMELDGRESATRAEGWIGTELYMSPERILCEGDTPAGDVYAAVSTVFEVLVGETLGRTPVLEERHVPFIEQRLGEVRARLEEDDVDTDVIDQVVQAMRGGLATEPHDRPAAAELADLLDGLARRLPGEGLTVFARRVVPSLSQKLASTRQPASGVLSAMPDVTGLRDATGATRLSSPDTSVLPMAPPPAGGARRSRWPTLLAVGLGALLLTVGVGVVALGGIAAAVGQFGGGPTATVTPKPVPTKPPPTPTVEPVPEPAPAPTAVPDPEPDPEPVPEPAPPEPSQPVPKPDVQPEPVPAPVPAADAPRVAKAQVSMADASSLRVTCGEVAKSGTASVRITDFPAGSCTVEAVYLGSTYQHHLTMDRPRGYTCAVAEGALSCR